MTEVRYCAAPEGWTEEGPNPALPGGEYGPQWSGFRVAPELTADRLLNGRSPRGLYSLRISPDAPDLLARLADFLRYETVHARTVILGAPDPDGLVRDALTATPRADLPRAADPPVLVHSTDLDAWASIRADGALLCLAELRCRGDAVAAIGCEAFGEPDDYADYVMLNRPDRLGPENVVASRARGRVFTFEDEPYLPGVRLYFDAARILGDGLGVRDGLHPLKVRERLPLAPYLLASVTAADVDPTGQVPVWTPRRFHDAANAWFAARTGVSL